jgi:hypothetical protein
LHTLFVRTSVDTGCLLVGACHIFSCLCCVLFCLWSVSCAQCWMSLDCISLSLICVLCSMLNESGLFFFVLDLCFVPNVEWVWIVFLCLRSVFCAQCWMSLDCFSLS